MYIFCCLVRLDMLITLDEFRFSLNRTWSINRSLKGQFIRTTPENNPKIHEKSIKLKTIYEQNTKKFNIYTKAKVNISNWNKMRILIAKCSKHRANEQMENCLTARCQSTLSMVAQTLYWDESKKKKNHYWKRLIWVHMHICFFYTIK